MTLHGLLLGSGLTLIAVGGAHIGMGNHVYGWSFAAGVFLTVLGTIRGWQEGI